MRHPVTLYVLKHAPIRSAHRNWNIKSLLRITVLQPRENDLHSG